MTGAIYILSMLLLSIIAALSDHGIFPTWMFIISCITIICLVIVVTMEESEQKDRIDALEKKILEKDASKTDDDAEVTK